MTSFSRRKYNFFSDCLERSSLENLTPLLLAAQQNHADIFEALVAKGACLYGQCTKLQNVLHYAVKNKNRELVQRIMHLDSDERVLQTEKNVRGKAPGDLDPER